jgi:hypothetical protein
MVSVLGEIRSEHLPKVGTPTPALSNVFIYWGASDWWLWRRGRPVAIAIIIIIIIIISNINKNNNR